MLDGIPLVDAHVHVPLLATLRPAWVKWARDFGSDGILEDAWDADGLPRPERLDELFAGQGVDVALLFCEYSPKATGIQAFDDLLPIVEHNPQRFRPVANVNPHLHVPIATEVKRQLDLGAAALKLHPVHGGFQCSDRSLYPAYQVLQERRVPLVVHCGTSSFPGSVNENADPQLLLPVIRDFPGLDIVLAHGGRSSWYDLAATMALDNETVWIELSGLPPKRLPDYYAGFDLSQLARRWIFGTDWPGVPGTAQNARTVAGLLDHDVAAAVLGGNAMRVYAGLPQLPKPPQLTHVTAAVRDETATSKLEQA
jgi:predicted TIM-barrel fold metal-dependent hydrolase